MGRRLEAADVLALARHLPVGEHGQLGRAPAQEGAEAEGAVDDGRGGEAVRPDLRLVEEDLLGEAGHGRREAEVLGEAGLGRGVAGADRAVVDEELRARAHDGEAEVAVIQDGEGGGPEALVRDPVLEDEAGRAEPRREAPLETQVLAEQPHLPRLALDLQQVVVAAPLLAHAQVLGGEVRRTAVEAVAVALGVRRAHVVETTGGDEPSAEGAEPPEAKGLVERGRAERGVKPRERPAGMLGRAEVEPAVEEHLETEAGARVDVRRADAPHPPIRELHETNAGDLRHPPDQPAQRPFLDRAPEDAGHVTPCRAA